MLDLNPELERLIRVASFDIGYPPESIIFVLRNGWTASEASFYQHIYAEELCWRLRDRAVDEFGSAAREKLSEWGIESTSDFGRLVFGMADFGLMAVNERDQIDDFDDVFEFDSAFNGVRNPEPVRLQWSIGKLLVLTTLAAVVVSGVLANGTEGIAGALISAWFVFLGLGCVVVAVVTRDRGWILLILTGSLFFLGGAVCFFALTNSR
ncbi:MAG: Minf_1886 family protein [Planctomycetota bacterium]